MWRPTSGPTCSLNTVIILWSVLPTRLIQAGMTCSMTDEFRLRSLTSSLNSYRRHALVEVLGQAHFVLD